MDASSPVPPIERLLAERAWVRAFARSLVADEAAADDLAQQAWVAALEAPPSRGDSPRGWFATVLRRAAAKGRRSAMRLGRRERAAARSEAVAATSDVVAQAELEHRVVAAVLALEEPYRSTVLLRWYEGVPPRGIAARMGVPVETVRSRAQRALARLRDGLDRAHGGRRSAWAVVLLGGRGQGLDAASGRVGLSGPDEGPTGGGAAVARGGRAAWVVAALATAVVVVVMLGRPAADRPVEEDARSLPGSAGAFDPVPASTPESPVLAGAGGAASGASAAPPAAPAPAAPAAEPPGLPAAPDRGTVAVEVEIVEAGVTPDRRVEGAGLRWVHRQGCGDGHVGQEAEVVMFGTPPFTGWVTAPGFVPHRFVEVGAVPTLRVELRRGLPAEVRFTGDDGQPLPIEELRARYAASSSLRHVHVIPTDAPASTAEALRRAYGPPTAWLLESELLLSGDEPRLRDALDVGSWVLSIPRPDLPPARVRGTTVADGRVRFEVHLPSPRRVRVHLVAAESGQALGGAQVIRGPRGPSAPDEAPTPPWTADEDGWVELPRTPEGEGGAVWWVVAEDHGAVFEEETTLRPGSAPVEVRVPLLATLRGRAYTPAGKPAARWDVIASGVGFRVQGAVRDDGRFELLVPAPLRTPASRGLRVVLTLVDPAVAEIGAAEARAYGGEVTEAAIGTSSEGRATATIRGRLTAGGRPLSGRPVMAGGPPAPGGEPTQRVALTGPDGRFELAGLEPVAWTLLVLPGGHAPGFGPGALQGLGPWVLRPDEVRPLVVDLPGGRVRVRVQEGAAGAAVGRADVRAIPRMRAVRELGGLSFTPGSLGRTGPDGTVVLDGLDPGAPHQVLVSKPDSREPVAVDAVPAEGEVIPEVVVRLP